MIYEVSVKSTDEIKKKIFTWLRSGHVERVLSNPGFISAELYESSSDSEIVVRYTVSSSEDLEKYIETAAPQLRDEGLKLFGDSMKASRRVLKLSDTFYR